MITQIITLLITFFLTSVIGVKIANSLKRRDSAQERYESELKSLYEKMISASDRLSKIAGERLYLSQRVLLLANADEDAFSRAREELGKCIISWNKGLMQVELEIRTLFSNSSLIDFESLQARLALLTSQIMNVKKENRNSVKDLLKKVSNLRANYFSFIQGMMDEAAIISRQMHFGVILPLHEGSLHHFTTWELVKNLIFGGQESTAIVRAPSDLGAPVIVDHARLGIHQERGYGRGLL